MYQTESFESLLVFTTLSFLFLFVFIRMFRYFFELFIGKQATNVLLGSLTADIVRGIVRGLARLFRWLLGRFGI